MGDAVDPSGSSPGIVAWNLRAMLAVMLLLGSAGGAVGSPKPLSVPNCTFSPPTGVAGCPPFSALTGESAPSVLGVSYCLVQRAMPLTAAWQSGPAMLGARVIGTFHDDTVLVRADSDLPGTCSAFSAAPDVLWSGPYLPAYKVAWALAPLFDGDPANDDLGSDDDGNLGIRAVFHRYERAADYAQALAGLVEGVAPGSTAAFLAPIDPGFPDAQASLSFLDLLVPVAASGEVVALLARAEAVAQVEPWAFEEPAMNEAAWALQTGIDRDVAGGLDVAAKLFARGVNGRGQIVAVLDRGFEPYTSAQCGLRYGPNAADAPAIAVEVDATTVFSGPPSISYRPDNKVIAHYLLRSLTPDPRCRPYPESTLAAKHGIGSLSVVAGDNFAVLAARAGEGLDDPADDEEGADAQAPIEHGCADVLQPNTPTCTRDPLTTRLDHHQDRDGVAPGAQVIIQDFNPPNPEEHGLPDIECRFAFVDVLEQAYRTSNGARIHNNSWGVKSPLYRLGYGSNCQAYDDVHWRFRDMLALFSAGNEGDAGVRQEARLKSGLAVGNLERRNASIMSSSSVGDGFGGMQKPDVMTQGHDGRAGRASSEWGDPAWPASEMDPNFTCCGDWLQVYATGGTSGTSAAAPAASGQAVLVRQYFADGYYPGGAAGSSPGYSPSNALVRATLINAARNLGGPHSGDSASGLPDSRPTWGQGWGAPVLDDTLFFAGDPTPGAPVNPSERSFLLVLDDVPNGLKPAFTNLVNDDRQFIVEDLHPAITAGEINEYLVEAEAGEELRVTLAWSDTPGTPTYDDAGNPQPGGDRPIRNDLDLEVVAPDGTVWRGRPSEGSLGGTLRTWLNGQMNGLITAPCDAACPAQCALTADENASEQSGPSFCDFQTRDRSNTVENIFLAPGDVLTGTYRVRVIGFDVPGNGLSSVPAYPNLIDVDIHPSSGLPLLDYDLIDDTDQGYALVVSGNVASSHGIPYFDASLYTCGDSGRVYVRDRDGGAGSVTVTTSAGDCDTFSLAPAGGAQPAWLRVTNSFVIRDADDWPASCGPGVGDGVVVTGDDAQIVATYTDALPSARARTATSRVICRNVSLSALSLAEPCATAVWVNGGVDRGETVHVDVEIRNDSPGGRDVTSLVGEIFPFDEDAVANPSVIVFPSMLTGTPTATAGFDLHLDADQACDPREPLRFRVELSDGNGFVDRLYFNIDQTCDASEVPPADDPATGETAMRAERIGPATGGDVQLTWDAVPGADFYNVWRGDLNALNFRNPVQPPYTHAIDTLALIGQCNIPSPTSTLTLAADGTWFGSPVAGTPGPNYYYLVTAEQTCAGPSGALHGVFGFADSDRDGTRGAAEAIPPGVQDASCLP